MSGSLKVLKNGSNGYRKKRENRSKDELTKIHFKLLHYTLNKSDEFPLDISFFNQNYPSILLLSD